MAIKTSARWLLNALCGLLLSVLCLGGCGGSGSGNSVEIIPFTTSLDGLIFTVIPLDSSRYVSLVPLGNLNPSGHVFPTDHHYFYLSNPDEVVPVKSPGNIFIDRVAQMEHLTDGFTDYKISFQISQEASGTFGHLSSLHDFIVSQVGAFPLGNTYSTGGKTYRYSSKNVWIKVQAGETIGTAGGNPGQSALDFGIYDLRVTHEFSNPSRVSEMNRYLNAVPCLDYFSLEEKAILESRCGDWDGQALRTVPPIGGTVAQDVPGTTQGLWFRFGDSFYPEDPHLALVHDNVDPTTPVFSIGTSIPDLESGTYAFTPETMGETNRDFNDINVDGKVYGFQDFDSGAPHVIVIQLVNSSTLWIERRVPGTGPPWSFTGNETEFVR